MKNLIILLSLSFLFFLSCQQEANKNDAHHNHADHQESSAGPANTKKSIPSEAHGQVGNVHVMIDYHAPGVRGRVIYGGLVPFGEVWVTGAHNATSITFSEEIEVEGKRIPAGKYAFFTIPGEEVWTIILNKNWDQHLADEYSAEEDIIRVEVVPETDLELQERLNYKIVESSAGEGKIYMQWEKRAVSLLFKESQH